MLVSELEHFYMEVEGDTTRGVFAGQHTSIIYQRGWPTRHHSHPRLAYGLGVPERSLLSFDFIIVVLVILVGILSCSAGSRLILKFVLEYYTLIQESNMDVLRTLGVDQNSLCQWKVTGWLYIYVYCT